MKYHQIKLGTKIELELYDEKGKKIPAVFVSQYGGYDEKANIMEIYAPIFQGNVYPIPPKMAMDVIFRKGKETYAFKAEAVERVYEGNIAMLYIRPLLPIQKIERRSFYRMECRLEVQYRVFEDLLPDNVMYGDFITSYTRDISGGGICLLTDKKLDNGLYVEALLKISKRIRFVGIVVRSQEIKLRGKIMYETGIEFVRIENKAREQIISYIFKIQRERLKKGRLRYDRQIWSTNQSPDS